MANRVTEILDNTTVNSWRVVKEDMSQAHLGTRGLTKNQKLDRRGLHGPTWMKSEDQCPKKPKIKDVDLEKVFEETCNKLKIIEALSAWLRCSNCKRLRNTIAYYIRVIETDKPKVLIMIAEEKMKATKARFRSVQQESFKEDKPTKFQKFYPFLSEAVYLS